MRFDVVIDSKFEKSEPKVTKEVTAAAKKVIPVKWQNGERIPLIGPEETLVIQPPKGIDFQDCYIRVKSKVDVLALCSYTHSHWKIQIPPSDEGGADAPATVNLTLATDEPNGQ